MSPVLRDPFCTSDLKAFYDEHGFCTIVDLVNPDVIANAHAAALAVQRGEASSGVPPMIVHATPEGKPGLLKVDNAWWADERLWALARHPEIGRVAAELLGCDEVFLWHDQLLIKPPAVGNVANVGWHQDRYYWQVLGGNDIVTAWIPLADLTENMGPLRFVDGSHRWGLQQDVEGFTPASGHEGRSVSEARSEENWQEHTVLLPSGGVSFHSPYTLHGSGPNQSGKDRPGLALHLIGSDVTVRRGRLHSAQAITSAADGELWRGPRTPRLWPPVNEPLDLVGDLEHEVHQHWVNGSKATAAFRTAAEVSLTGPLWSWYAGRDDERDLEKTIDHPMRMLTDTATLHAKKHPAYANSVLDIVELIPKSEWSGHHWSPSIVAETLLNSRQALGDSLHSDDDLLNRVIARAERLRFPP